MQIVYRVRLVRQVAAPFSAEACAIPALIVQYNMLFSNNGPSRRILFNNTCVMVVQRTVDFS